MRTLLEIKSEMENTNRRMAQLVIQQSSIDSELHSLDRCIRFLERELGENQNSKGVA